MTQVPSSEEVYEGNEINKEKSYIGNSLTQRQLLYHQSIEQPEKFWSRIAKEDYAFTQYWDDENNNNNKVCEYNFDKSKGPISIQWFPNSKTNVCYNCLDRHDPQRVCFYYEDNDNNININNSNNNNNNNNSLSQLPPNAITYGSMLQDVKKLSHIFRFHYGLKKGDIVVLYLPVIPFTVQCMLACARIGVVVSVVFGGFSAAALATRLLSASNVKNKDSNNNNNNNDKYNIGTVKLLVTCDVSRRGSKVIPLKKSADAALATCESAGLSIPCLVFQNNNNNNNSKKNKISSVPMQEGRDVWYHALHQQYDPSSLDDVIEWLDAEDPLFLLYTSGSTGAPKAILHTTAGYMVYAGTTFKYTFDYHKEDVYFCTADVGWITGHSYLVYGPLLHGATSILYEGLPNYPTASRWWEIIEKYKVSIFYTAPTAIRSLMQLGDEHVNKCNLSSLRVLGSVGEPINAEAWRWFYKVVGKGNADIVDTWWQTETGGHMITPLPGCTPQKPGCASLPFFGVLPVLLDPMTLEEKTETAAEGLLAIKAPWPGIARSLLNDHEKFEATYFSAKGGYYITGDGARRDSDGYIWITGRVDDVLNVSGHRIGTSEVENAVNKHPAVVESAVVGVPHEVKGESIYVFLTFKEGTVITKALLDAVKQTVRGVIGPLATPDYLHPTSAAGLPKTRSGKIVRRVLRKIATQKYDDMGDLSTLANSAVIPELIALQKEFVLTKSKI